MWICTVPKINKTTEDQGVEQGGREGNLKSNPAWLYICQSPAKDINMYCKCVGMKKKKYFKQEYMTKPWIKLFILKSQWIHIKNSNRGRYLPEVICSIILDWKSRVWAGKVMTQAILCFKWVFWVFYQFYSCLENKNKTPKVVTCQSFWVR